MFRVSASEIHFRYDITATGPTLARGPRACGFGNSKRGPHRRSFHLSLLSRFAHQLARRIPAYLNTCSTVERNCPLECTPTRRRKRLVCCCSSRRAFPVTTASEIQRCVEETRTLLLQFHGYRNKRARHFLLR